MQLTEVQVHKFRNVVDSTPVSIDGEVTCLVGKNESGKTAFLQALYLLNPARPNVKLSSLDQYPAWMNKRDRQAGEDLDAFRPIRATFTLGEDDIAAVTAQFGKGVYAGPTLTLSKDYGGTLYYTVGADEGRAVANIIGRASVSGQIGSEVGAVTDLASLDALIADAEARGAEDPAIASAATALHDARTEVLGDNDVNHAVWKLLQQRVPKFFYYADYSRLPGIVKIRELLQADPTELDDDDHTALALLRLAGTDDDYMLNPDYETRKRELESVANLLTQDVLAYWTQNPYLRVLIDIDQTNETNDEGQQIAVLDQLHVRMWDDRHMLSLPFDERSTGFKWFFSFLAAFSEFESGNAGPVVILLDEPALGLHARAQKDYLRFINERLSPKQQVIYSTHSPFMVEPDRLDRARVVEDKGRDEGTIVTSDVLSTDPDTLFPLQGALGYDLSQHLLVGPHNLLVEGTSDLTYLAVLSDHLRDLGRTSLDDAWSVVPTGGADTIPTFVALLGIHLDVTVLIDAKKGGHQRLSHLASEGYLAATRIVTVGDVLGRKEADIEDLFGTEDYLALYNAAFGTTITASDLSGTDRLVRRISRHNGVDFVQHGKPADVLLRTRDAVLPTLSEQTLARFEKLFEMLNATLPI